MLGEAVFSERPREQHQQLARSLPLPAQGAPPTDGPLSTAAAAAADGKACLAARTRSRPPRRAYCRARAGGSPWAAAEGQDFLADHASPDIDFATFHAWVDNWKARAPAPVRLRPARRARGAQRRPPNTALQQRLRSQPACSTCVPICIGCIRMAGCACASAGLHAPLLSGCCTHEVRWRQSHDVVTARAQAVDEGFLRAWIRAHVEDAAKLRKPARPAAAGGLGPLGAAAAELLQVLKTVARGRK